MVTLREMTSDEFDRWAPQTQKSYAASMASYLGYSQDEAARRAKESFARLLHSGQKTPNHYFYAVINGDGETVGHVWFAINPEGSIKRAFLYDIEIKENFRQLGYGRQAMEVLEKIVREMGAHKLGLHVFGRNHVARDLYNSLGFDEVSINMDKILD